MPSPIIRHSDWLKLKIEAAVRSKRDVPFLYSGCLKPRIIPMRGAVIEPWPAYLPIVPREQWPDLIKSGAGSFLQDMRRDILPVHNQGSTNRCWAHGSVRALELLRLWECQSPLLLSPDSVAYPIEGTRDRGGWPEDACLQLANSGACPQTSWPEAELSPRNAAKDWKDQALNHVLLKWVFVSTWEQQMTCALRRIPVATVIPWWNHLVCFTGPALDEDGVPVIWFDNSWDPSWGEDGSALMDEKSGTTVVGSFAAISETFSEHANN